MLFRISDILFLMMYVNGGTLYGIYQGETGC